MNNHSPKDRDEALLDAVLNDPAWAEGNSAIKAAAVREFRAAQRRRRVAYFARAAAVVMLAGGACWWMRPSAERPQAVVSVKPRVTPPALAQPVTNSLTAITAVKPDQPHYISEREMLAMFPKGSCAIVVLNGKRELVFLDPKVEQEGAVYQPQAAL